MPHCNPHDLKDKDFKATAEIIEIQQEVDFFGLDWYEPTCFAIEIFDAKYEKVQIKDVVNPLEYLSTQQKAVLKQVLSEFTKLFDGTLGVCSHRKFYIELDPGAKPRHARPFPVPVTHLETLKKELIHLCELCVLGQPQGATKWSSPTLSHPQKDGRIHWVTDLRELDKVARRQQYPLPIIQDIIRKCTGYKFFTKIDISMHYCTIELNEESNDLCTISTPLVKSSATDYLWVLNVPLTLPKRLWEKYLGMLLKWRSI